MGRAYYENLARYASRVFSDAEGQRAFVAAMRQESDNFDPDVVECRRDSSAGARGIAQIMPQFHPTVNPCDPEAALAYAARWLTDLRATYGGDLVKAYAAYNAGQGRVNEAIHRLGPAWEMDLPAETRAYLAVVFAPEPHGTLPVSCPITQGFGENPNNGIYGPGGHPGIDFGCATGTPVRAVNGGRVVFADWLYNPSFPGDQTRGYGRTVIVRSGPSEVYYAHNLDLHVALGADVARGQVIALSGNTGMSTGPHLHLEERINGRAVNPTHLLSGTVPPPEPEPAPSIAATVAATDGLKVRTGPGTQYPEVDLLPWGTGVQVRERGVWCELAGRPGHFVAGGWLDFTTPVPPADDTAVRESAIRAWTAVRDGAAFVFEDAEVKSTEAKRQAQETIDQALAELRALGVTI